MTTEQENAVDVVRESVSSAPAYRLLERLAELVSARAGVRSSRASVAATSRALRGPCSRSFSP